jgi:hypothetical protein
MLMMKAADAPLSLPPYPMDAVMYPERRNFASRDQLLGRVLAEFNEMPCMRLRAAQTQRLLGLRADVAARVLATLLARQALWMGPDGRYAARA